jgi:hypothetical protein
MAKKMPIKGKVGGEDVTFVDLTPEEMKAEIVRLNNVLFDALRSLGTLRHSKHQALESARFALTHGGSHRKREDRGGWNTPKKRK